MDFLFTLGHFTFSLISALDAALPYIRTITLK